MTVKMQIRCKDDYHARVIEPGKTLKASWDTSSLKIFKDKKVVWESTNWDSEVYDTDYTWRLSEDGKTLSASNGFEMDLVTSTVVSEGTVKVRQRRVDPERKRHVLTAIDQIEKGAWTFKCPSRFDQGGNLAQWASFSKLYGTEVNPKDVDKDWFQICEAAWGKGVGSDPWTVFTGEVGLTKKGGLQVFYYIDGDWGAIKNKLEEEGFFDEQVS